jgi:uncharacterized small protein (DUF1192 family)
MFDDEDLPRKPRRMLDSPKLDMLGIEELEAYIAELEAEIARVKGAIGAKSAHRDAASLFFKAKPKPDAE